MNKYTFKELLNSIPDGMIDLQGQDIVVDLNDYIIVEI